MERSIEYVTPFGQKIKVELEIGNYQNNNCMYIGINQTDLEYPEPYGDVTVNLDGKVPDYSGYVDINNDPGIVDFIEKNELGAYTGIMGQSGYCYYPLYLFDVEKLRQLAPESMERYEKAIGNVKAGPMPDREKGR